MSSWLDKSDEVIRACAPAHLAGKLCTRRKLSQVCARP